VKDALHVALSSGVRASLSDILDPSDGERLERFAAHLPTVREGIVEIPLGPARAGAGPDFHLMPHSERDRARLIGGLRQFPSDCDTDRADAMVLARLIESWPSDAGLVCEYDVDAGASLRLPSLFLNFPRAWAAADHVAAQDLLFRLLPGWEECRPGIDALPAAAGSDARVSWIGVMLPRRPRFLRVNLAFVGAGQLRSILDGRLPPDRVATACDALGWALDAADRAVLAVDLSAEGLGGDIGLECFNDGDAGRTGFLEAALRRGLIREREARAVCSWPGCTTPASRAAAPWPDAWIVDDLLGDGRLPSCRRTINHLKVTAKASGQVTLKAYLRFHLDWTLVEGGASPVVRPTGAAAGFLAAARASPAVRDAIRQAFAHPFPPHLADVARRTGFALDAGAGEQGYRSNWMARRLGS